MARIFLSHASADKPFVRDLAADLIGVGHTVWVDEDQIVVGQSIPGAIAEGLRDCDFIVVVLSEAAVKSGWVAKEWESRIDDDIIKNGSIILPILIGDCEIPQLLKSKKYADFRRSERVGFADLCKALETRGMQGIHEAPVRPSEGKSAAENAVYDLLESIADKKQSLAGVLPRVVALARLLDDKELEDFAKSQIVGVAGLEWETDNIPDSIKCRLLDVWVSTIGEVNPQYIGWAGSADAMMRHIKTSKEFKRFQKVLPDPIQWIEDQSSRVRENVILQTTASLKELTGNPDHSDDKVYPVYLEPNSYQRTCDLIRSKVVAKLGSYL